MIISQSFYNRNTPTVARDLLGCFLVREYRGKIVRVMITETEAYRGEYDLACHASKGRTPRTETLYSEPGTAYVYLIYGMYWMLNVVTEHKDFPAAVLVRAVSIDYEKYTKFRAGQDQAKTREKIKSGQLVLDGPGKLTKFLHIDRSLNGHDLTKGERLWLECPPAETLSTPDILSLQKPRPAGTPARRKIIAAPRIGVDYARHCKDWKWNFRLVQS